MSFNDVVIPIIAWHCDDIQFRYTMAHELGKCINFRAKNIFP